MRNPRVWIVLSTILVCTTVAASAQGRKPGLWEITSTMTWQQSPLPPGMSMPGGAANPFGGGTHTSQICLTQAMIDKYGAPPPQTRDGCQITNVVKTDHSMSADLVCSGRITGKGAVESSWDDSDHAKGKVHFTGSMQAGPNSKPIEWSAESTSVFKSSDCGSVKPIQMPSDK